MPYKLSWAVLTIILWFTSLVPPGAEAGRPVPINLFNIGNSIGEGEAADSTIGLKQHDVVWSTGYNLNDIPSPSRRLSCAGLRGRNDIPRRFK